MEVHSQILSFIKCENTIEACRHREYNERKSLRLEIAMNKYYMVFRVLGLEYCIINDRLEISNIEDNRIDRMSLTKENDVCVFFFELNTELCENNSDRMRKYYTELKVLGEEIIDKIFSVLIMKGFDIDEIVTKEPSIRLPDKGKDCIMSSITITNINTEHELKEINEDDLSISSSCISPELLEIILILKEPDQALRFENLYEKLKSFCGGTQINVTKKIKDNYKQKYNINCENHNISSEYCGDNVDKKWQDDFTYLRTLISHGGDSRYADDINERLKRDTFKIVKVLKDEIS